MTHFVGLDVSQKMTAICVVDNADLRLELWLRSGRRRKSSGGLLLGLDLSPSRNVTPLTTFGN